MVYVIKYSVVGTDGKSRTYYDGFDRGRGCLCPAKGFSSTSLCAYSGEKPAKRVAREVKASFAHSKRRGIVKDFIGAEVIEIGETQIPPRNFRRAEDNAASRYYYAFAFR